MDTQSANQVRGGLKVETLVHNNRGPGAGAEKPGRGQSKDRSSLHSLPPPPASPEDEGLYDIVSSLCNGLTLSPR